MMYLEEEEYTGNGDHQTIHVHNSSSDTENEEENTHSVITGIQELSLIRLICYKIMEGVEEGGG